MAQPEFTAARLAQFMEEILTAPQRLAAAAAAAHGFGRPDAASRLADLALAASGANGLENAA